MEKYLSSNILEEEKKLGKVSAVYINDYTISPQHVLYVQHVQGVQHEHLQHVKHMPAIE